MNKSILIKLFICTAFIFMISINLCLPVSHALENMFESGKAFLKEGNDIGETINTQELKTTSDIIYNTLFGIAVAVAVIIAMVLGIQFMVASTDEKAKVKEALLPFLVGCFVVFSSFTIWKIAVKIGNGAEQPTITDMNDKGYLIYDQLKSNPESVSSLSKDDFKSVWFYTDIGGILEDCFRKGKTSSIKEVLSEEDPILLSLYIEAKNRNCLNDNGYQLNY